MSGLTPSDRDRADVPTLPADGLELRPWRVDDVAGVLLMADDPMSRQWSRSMRSLHTAADAQAWLKGRHAPGRVEWAVDDLSSGELVGRVGLHAFDEVSRSAEIGYGVTAARRGRGVAALAVQAALRHGFEALGLARVSLIHAVGNPASCSVATRCGFAFEGVERQAFDHGDGVRHDLHRHARLATDPPGEAPQVLRPIEPLSCPVGPGLLLRALRPADAPAFLDSLRDLSAARWSARPPPQDLAHTRQWINGLEERMRDGVSVYWAVADQDSDLMLGAVGLSQLDRIDGIASASYWVAPAARGRGVATAALSTATLVGFSELGLHRVQLTHAVANVASCRVATRAGFALEGTSRESSRLAVGYVDEHVHARLVTDAPADVGGP